MSSPACQARRPRDLCALPETQEMSLTHYQREVCQLLAADRRKQGEQYIGGGAALNEWLKSVRVSHDVDLFHDALEAVLESWTTDRQALERAGHIVHVIREFPSFVEAEITRGDDGVILQWVQDSAFRFFPLVEHPDFGLALHPFDLATNKTLALIGRTEIRDWFDIIHCHVHMQPFGYLVWAAAGKDPGLTPPFILDQAGRSTHYSKAEYETLVFDGPAPDPESLVHTWRSMLEQAEQIVDRLPEDQLGTCVMTNDGTMFEGAPDALEEALRSRKVCFHQGCLRGAWPQIAPPRHMVDSRRA